MEGSCCADELGLKTREEFSAEHRENKSIAYMAMKQLHPVRMSAPSHGYDLKIGSVTGRGQEVHSEPGMTGGRPEEWAGICATRCPALPGGSDGAGEAAAKDKGWRCAIAAI